MRRSAPAVLLHGFVVALVLLSGVAAAQPAAVTGDKTTAHTLHLANGPLEFGAEVATMRLANPQGAAQADIVTTSFVLKEADPAKRPVMFALNGGPGASSAWLDLGAIGPWRIPFGANGVIPSRSPTPIENADTWLDFADLVFIDPPGTGYSRVTAKEDEVRRHFFTVDGDIDTLAVVIRRWLETHGRLQAPKFIVGESYGGFRGPLLARRLLDRQGVGVSGLVLISPVLDFNGREAPFSPFGFVNTLPSMAAAYRHASSRADVQDVETYATGDFLADLLRGEADAAASERLAAHVAALTGLDPALVRRRSGRIGIGTFLRNRQAGEVDSPYDATVAAADPFPAAEHDNSPDPLLDGMRGPLTSGMLYVYHTWLDWQPEGAPARQYEILNEQIAREWDYGRRMTRPESYTQLRQFLALDPSTRVAVAHGLTDLVTPYFASALLLRQMPEFDRPSQVELLTYGGGHMFYSRDASRAALHRDAAALVASAMAARP